MMNEWDLNDMKGRKWLKIILRDEWEVRRVYWMLRWMEDQNILEWRRTKVENIFLFEKELEMNETSLRTNLVIS